MIYRAYVVVCEGTACVASGSIKVRNAFLDEIEKRGLSEEVKVMKSGCGGTCELGPVVVIYPDMVLYPKVRPEDVPLIVEEHLLKGRPVESLILHEITGKVVTNMMAYSFFAKQHKIVLENSGRISPESIDEYIAQNGYEALARVLTEMTPEEVIEEIKRSGLRGRGGAGFPTGMKWEFTRKAPGDEKYVICNADEGDPGAFMDESVMEGDPHRVLEGMAIAAYAIGDVKKGYIYIRAEYPLAIERLEIAMSQAREYGLLGENILDTGFNFDLEIRIGAGAFVCGEETALIKSVEGGRGEPRPKPPFPANKGVWGKPTNINNVETYANIAPIIRNGADWYASIGTETSKGTKVFSLTGKVNNIGLVEVPMGTTVGEMVFDIGGGIPDGKKFKAVQTGGPSGGCIPAPYLDVPIDYESLKELGAIMGSGGMIVLDEDTCMVNIAKYFLEFTVEESCGQCVPCRIGLRQMLNIMERITNGNGELKDLDTLETLGELIISTSLCGLGQTAPNPVLSTLRYFRDEYVAHIVDKKCPATVCAALYYAPCENACPAGVDPARYLSLVAENKIPDAYYVHMESNPFPAACARVCPAFCEKKCNRQKFDEAVAIREVKRVFADWALKDAPSWEPPKDPRKERVAIIGAGPAGLACAFYLTRLGYLPTVFEALPVAGGMMRVGIPDYRLPPDVLDREIERIVEAGVKLELNHKVDNLQSLFDDGYGAVFVGVGAHTSYKLNVPGEDMPGVYHGIDFLRDVNLGKEVKIGNKVVVVGGGNTAIDAARTALRLGSEEVNIIYRRTKDDMPAFPEEIEDALEEGVKIHFLVTPVKVLGDERVVGVECVRMETRGFDRGGRRRPVAVEGSNFVVEADTLIPCIGQGLTAGLEAQQELFNKWGFVQVDERTMKTSIPGVFSGGDAVNPATVVEAVAHGRKAAVEIDKYFGYEGVLPVPEREVVQTSYDEEAYLVTLPKSQPEMLPLDERKGFVEICKGLKLDQAIEEAKRCLHCDRPPEEIEEEEEEKEKVEKVEIGSG
jgi:NADH-quinone oxidoreductase subunit F